MRAGVAGHVADGNGDAIVHADNAKLRDRVLFKELMDECRDVLEGYNETIWPHVFLGHRDRHVENDD